MPPSALPSPYSVLIVGAGPTGLVLALWLTQLGIKVRIIDKTSEPGTTSRALGVHARTLEFYRQLGFAEEVVAGGIKAAGANLWVNRRKAARVPLSQMGEGQTAYPYLLIFPQDEHEKLLIRKLGEVGVRVERSTELLRFDQRDRIVRGLLKRPDGSEEQFEVPFLAGCDGASSTVRRTLTTLFPGGTYSHLFYVADVEASGPTTDDEVHIDLEDADFLAVFPLSRKSHVRVIGSVRDDLAGERDKLTFDDVRSKPMQNLKLNVTKENWFSTYRVHHRVAQNFREGRAFLLGDAAHVHSPVGAQGMNTGIGDAVNLSWKLAAVLADRAPDSLLDSYEQERIAFARKLVSTTDRIFAFATSRSALSVWIRKTLLPIILPRVMGVIRLRKILFRVFSQIGIRYRTSPLSAGSTGGVRGGDRLPWVSIQDGRDNFSAISGLTWSAHVYGNVPAGIQATCEDLDIRLHQFPWQPAMKDAGFTPGALYLLRPDGYVALAQAGCEPESLRGYFLKRGLQPAAALSRQ